MDAAASLFKENGIHAVGIAAIMKSAQLTNGAFYAHFETKNALVEAVISKELDYQLQSFMGAPRDAEGLKLLINAYLSTEHLNSCAEGCPSAALIGEVTKLHDEAKAIYMTGLHDIKELIEQRTPNALPNSAYAIFGLLIGTMQLARSVTDVSESEVILASGRQATFQLAGLGVISQS